MSSTSRAATARLRSVGAVESIAYSQTGGEVPLGCVGHHQVGPFGDELLDLQELLPRQLRAVSAAARDGIELMTTVHSS